MKKESLREKEMAFMAEVKATRQSGLACGPDNPNLNLKTQGIFLISMLISSIEIFDMTLSVLETLQLVF
jgi:hypothetical protein